MFPGPRTNPTFYNERLVRELKLLPAIIGDTVGDETQDEKFAHFQSKNYDHPIVSLWRNQTAGTIASARFYKYFQLIPPPEDTTKSEAASNAPKVVLRFDDGNPAVVEQIFGIGRVVQFASTCDIKWNDIAVRPAFVPLLHRVMAAITQHQDRDANLPVGQPYQRRMNAELIGQDVTVVNPIHEGDERDLEKIEMVNGNPAVTYANTDQNGLYQISLDDPPTYLKFAAQSDPKESSLAELSEADLEEIRRVASITKWGPMVDLRQSVEQQRVGAEFWLPLAILVLLVAGSETFLAQYFSRSK